MNATMQKITSVMLIDDNEIDNLINQKMLESFNFCKNIFSHTGAKSAIEYLRNVEKIAGTNTDFLPSLIFLDIDMPIMDGFQFLEEFEKLGDTTKEHCRIIMLTSSQDPKDLSRSKKSRFIIKYINKPLTHDNLKKVFE